MASNSTRITIKRGSSVGAHKDYYVVAGGGFTPQLTLSKTEANRIAAARRRLMAKKAAKKAAKK